MDLNITRAAADLGADALLASVQRIGIGDIPHRCHRRCLLVIREHDRRRLIRAVDGANQATLAAVFDGLRPDRVAAITHPATSGAPTLLACAQRPKRNASERC
jgi:transposase